MKNYFHKFPNDQCGGAAVEFSLVIPILFILIAVVTDFGLASVANSQLASSARAGIEHGFGNPDDLSGIEVRIRNNLADSPIDKNSLAVSITHVCECDNQSVVLCGNTCGGEKPRKFIEVVIGCNYTLLIPLPSIAQSIPLNFSGRFRVE